MKRFSFLVGLLLAAVFSQASPSTYVSGNVFGTWEPAGNPYLVVGDLLVPQGLSLDILPGCRIEFQGHFKFRVDSLAIFRAIGTETDSIIFTASDSSIGWNGLRFKWADASCSIAYCRFEWGRGARRDQYADISRCSGGAVCLIGGGLSIGNSLFLFNRAFEGLGGAVYADSTNISVTDCILEHNRSAFGGAAIYATYSNVLINGNIISKDTTFYLLGGEHGGGAVGCFYSTVEIRDNIITENSCGQSGGGMIISSSYAEVIGNTIGNNSAAYYGGGCSIGGIARIIGNTIYNNIAGSGSTCSGGGIACGGGITLINNTIVGNYSYWRGGGIRYWQGAAPDTFQNNIIWGNNAYSGDPQITPSNDPHSPLMTYSDIEGGWAGEGNIDSDPLFADTANGDFRLTWASYPLEDSTKSPCIDSGDPASPFDPDGTRADMGAIFFDRNSQGIDDEKPLPAQLSLSQNYPNPFNAQTIITCSLPQAGEVTIDIFDITGRKIKTLLSGYRQAGEQSVIWNAEDVSSGVYLYRIKAGEYQISKKCVLLK